MPEPAGGMQKPVGRSDAGNVRLRTLVGLRWIAVVGQSTAIFAVDQFMRFEVPIYLCLAVIGASALLNAFLSLRFPSTRLLKDQEATLYLAFDVIQLAVLLYLTGGIQNPFTILLIAPVTISAATLGRWSTLFLVALSFISVTLLSVYHLPLPWYSDEPFRSLPLIYKVGLWAAVMLGIAFTAGYVRRIASESSRLADAYSAAQMIMAREQRLSDLGALAAAAAHELGTPLATIQLIAKEIVNELPKDSPYWEDMELISSQITRCREILSRLSENKELGDAIYARQRLPVLIEEVVAPQRRPGKQLKVFFTGADDSPPEIWRRPEIIHGLENLIENAVDFARGEAAIETGWDDRWVEIRITDDGPGFAPEIEERLGEPYVTSRPIGRAGPRAAVSADRAGKTAADEEGMGLGFFIAKTLLERTGAQMSFSNHSGWRLPDGEVLKFGAYVKVKWPREALEATRLSDTGADSD